MTNIWKIIIAIILLALAGFGIWYTQGKPKTVPIDTGTAITEAVPTDASAAVSTDPSAMTITSKDSSDVGLDQDMTLIDEQLKTLNTSGAAVDQSLSDTPVSQI